MDGRMDVPDGHFRPPVMLLCGLLRVDLIKGHFWKTEYTVTSIEQQ